MGDDINTSWAKWEKQFLEIMKQSVPQGVLPKRKNIPWLTKSIIQLMRKRDAFHRKSHRSPSYQLKYKQYRNRVTSLIRSAKNKYLRQLKPSSKHFWKVVNSLNQKNTSIPTLIRNDTEFASPSDKACLLGDKFKNNCSPSPQC